MSEHKARLHPIWVGGRAGYVYRVIHDGKLLVDRSRDPECDAARALFARGITGRLVMCDGKTGIPRTVINIEKAAKLTAPRRVPRCTPLQEISREYGNACPRPRKVGGRSVGRGQEDLSVERKNANKAGKG